jgi:hypothetical protein
VIYLTKRIWAKYPNAALIIAGVATVASSIWWAALRCRLNSVHVTGYWCFYGDGPMPLETKQILNLEFSKLALAVPSLILAAIGIPLIFTALWRLGAPPKSASDRR